MPKPLYEVLQDRMIEQLRQRPAWLDLYQPWPSPPLTRWQRLRFDVWYAFDRRISDVRHAIGKRICPHDHDCY